MMFGAKTILLRPRLRLCTNRNPYISKASFVCGIVATSLLYACGTGAGLREDDTEPLAQAQAKQKRDDAQAKRTDLIVKLAQTSGLKSRQAKVAPYTIIAAARARKCDPSGGAAFMAALPFAPLSGSDGAIDMFALPPLVRYLFESGDCFSADMRAHLLQGLTSRQRLKAHGTLNHAIMMMTSWYLLAQYFPDAKWTDWDGKVYNSTELMALMKSEMSRRNWRMFQSGQYELLSPTYAMVNLFPLLNLFDFAADAEVRDIANAEATLEVMSLQAHSFNGTLVPPLTRRNYEQRNALVYDNGHRTSVAQHILWFYFGQPDTDDFDLARSGEPTYASILALSKWRPPEAEYRWQENAKAGYAIKLVTPEFAIWDADTWPAIYGDSYIGPHFALGTGNAVFNPEGYNIATQTWALIFESDSPRNQIECYQPYWRSNEGQDAWGTDRWSPFQQTYRYDDASAVVLYSIPQKDPWVYDASNRFYSERDKNKGSLFQVVNCRVPRDVDQIVTEDNWVFARKGKSYMALGTLYGRNEYVSPLSGPLSDYMVFKIRQPNTGLFVSAQEAVVGFSFADFIAATKANRPQYDVSLKRARWKTRSGSAVDMTFSLETDAKNGLVSSLPAVSINGTLLPTPPAQPVIDSPWMTLSSGTLNVTVPGAEFQMTAPRRR